MTEPDRQLAVCPGCDLSLYQLKLGYASASRNTIYIYTDYNIPLKNQNDGSIKQETSLNGRSLQTDEGVCFLCKVS